jgi:hypothetical protein
LERASNRAERVPAPASAPWAAGADGHSATAPRAAAAARTVPPADAIVILDGFLDRGVLCDVRDKMSFLVGRARRARRSPRDAASSSGDSPQEPTAAYRRAAGSGRPATRGSRHARGCGRPSTLPKGKAFCRLNEGKPHVAYVTYGRFPAPGSHWQREPVVRRSGQGCCQVSTSRPLPRDPRHCTACRKRPGCSPGPT